VWLAYGTSNAAIVTALNRSPNTFFNNVSKSFSNLHVADRPETIGHTREVGVEES
jgi:DNA-binding NarL/FixJ family response regulator